MVQPSHSSSAINLKLGSRRPRFDWKPYRFPSESIADSRPRHLSADATLIKDVVDFNVGWFLGDAEVWSRLARMFVWSFEDRFVGHVEKKMDIPWLVDHHADQRIQTIPVMRRPAAYRLVLNSNADQWRRIFEYTYRRFANSLGRAGLQGEDARWTSFGLSYEALCGAVREDSTKTLDTSTEHASIATGDISGGRGPSAAHIRSMRWMNKLPRSCPTATCESTLMESSTSGPSGCHDLPGLPDRGPDVPRDWSVDRFA